MPDTIFNDDVEDNDEEDDILARWTISQLIQQFGTTLQLIRRPIYHLPDTGDKLISFGERLLHHATIKINAANRRRLASNQPIVFFQPQKMKIDLEKAITARRNL